MRFDIANKFRGAIMPWQSSMRALGIEKKSEAELRLIWADIESIHTNDIKPFIDIFSNYGWEYGRKWYDKASNALEDAEKKLIAARRYERQIATLAKGLASVVPNEMQYEQGIVGGCTQFEGRLTGVINMVAEERKKVAKCLKAEKDLEATVSAGKQWSGMAPHHIQEGFLFAFMKTDQQLRPLLKTIKILFELERQMRRDIIRNNQKVRVS